MKDWGWLVLFLLCAAPGAAAATAEPVTVSVQEEAGHLVLSAQFVVAVPRERAWEVLVDFEHMADFLPNLKSSTVLQRQGNTLRIQQQGVTPLGFLKFPYESVREVELQPFSEIRSRSVGGDSGQLNSVTRLQGSEQQTEVSYRADWWPNSRLVVGLGKGTLRHMLGHQFTAMRQEMLRRQR